MQHGEHRLSLVRPVVSILTRPGGRVQPTSSAKCARRNGEFQSSPVPEDGCNTGRLPPTRGTACFNPHPSRRTGATIGILPPKPHLPGFNPHPSRRTGATTTTGSNRRAALRFNPHPSRRTGATKDSLRRDVALMVSILTRPGGRVQPHLSRTGIQHYRVSILTRPGGRVQHVVRRGARVPRLVSILTRPGGRVQHRRGDDGGDPRRRFNPHPSRRTGATRGSW